MHFALLGEDGTDPGAPARRLATRPRHVENLVRWARAGRLVLSGPRMPDDATTTGSLQFFDVPGPAAMQDYLREEPFAQEWVWASTRILPFRIAPLPYPAPPGTPGGEAGPVMCWAIIARDGTDADAPARRAAARPRHLERLLPLVGQGLVRLGGAILDAPDSSVMVGSIMAVMAPDEAAARALIAADPYVTEGVWQDIRLERWRIGPQPYKPLPGQAACAS